MKDWVSFWDSDHPIYVNARHIDVHYRTVADDIVALIPSPTAHVLDHGSGEALHADKIAARCTELLLCEAAPTVRARIADRFKADPKIRALAPEDVEDLPANSLDLIVANSLLHYLSPDERDAVLKAWKRILKPGGKLVIADVVPHRQSMAKDALSLLGFAAKKGFLIAAVLGLARTVFSDYGKIRAKLGLSKYSEAEILGILQGAGFRARRLPRNFGHNQQRMAFEATKPA
ncbi:MAG TPA: methyltransferase domain-containing protein [Xanthobacteraceae bacterium]|nr:methyltransferase domain-containing protein [Xanthobacteraceae bacterium]